MKLKMRRRPAVPTPQAQPTRTDDPYSKWVRRNAWTNAEAEVLASRLARLSDRPLVSVLMPVYNTDPRHLDEAIRSVVAQTYQNWELCIVDDASTAPAVAAKLAEWVKGDRRVRVATRTQNGHICRAQNDAFAMSSGPLLVLMDHDDVLAVNAVAEAVLAFADPEVDFVYSDEDMIDENGRRYGPNFKPDWSPELLLATNYLNHLTAMRRELWERVGGLRPGYEGSQDHDLYLRLSRVVRRVAHVPRILYHYRKTATSMSGSQIQRCFDAGEAAISDHLTALGVPGHVKMHPVIQMYEVGFPDDGPRVSIIVPTIDAGGPLLAGCFKGLEKTSYRDFEVVVVETGARDGKPPRLQGRDVRKVSLPQTRDTFNFSKCCNAGVAAANGQLLVFLNDDAVPRDETWLSDMAGLARLPGVGVVGAKLLTEDDRLQHAGTFLQADGFYPSHVYHMVPDSVRSYREYTNAIRNTSGVTGACMMVPADVFSDLGGFDERLAVYYNDTDLCNRVRQRGLRVAYCPAARLTHPGGSSRAAAEGPSDGRLLYRELHGAEPEPCNPNLLVAEDGYSIRPRRAVQPGKKKLRVAAFTHMLNRTGAPLAQFRILERLHADGLVHVSTVLSPSDGPLRQEYERLGAYVEVAGNPFRASASADAVYANTVAMQNAVIESGRPCVWHIHESIPTDMGRLQLAMDTAYGIVFPCHATMEVYRRLGATNVHVVENGLDPNSVRPTGRLAARSRLGLDEREFVVISVGTFETRKRQEDVVAACLELPEALFGRLRWLHAGTHDVTRHGEWLGWLLDGLHPDFAGRFRRLGSLDDLSDLYAVADVMVMSSDNESQPLVLIEAMARGIPIITTPIYGIPAMVVPGGNAMIYQPGDVEGLTKCLTAVLDDGSIRSRMADASRRCFASHPTFESQCRRMHGLLWEAYLAGG